MIRPIKFSRSAVYILDQRLLPDREKWLKLTSADGVARAIKNMTIRGAPAIGVASAMGIALGIFNIRKKTPKELEREFKKLKKNFSLTRPTARNLFFAIEKMEEAFYEIYPASGAKIAKNLKKTALQIAKEDFFNCVKIGAFGAKLVRGRRKILTHCNAGALATAGYGTALGVIRSARKAGGRFLVYASETRPYLQGARLTAWELQKEKIPVVVITDNTAGYLMRKGEIDCVIVGADRIAQNGDAANKIGTYTLAVLARTHRIPFYVAAPTTTIDASLKTGKDIPIEKRSGTEVLSFNGKRIAPRGVNSLYYAFDITPAEYISAIITEKGIFKKPYKFK